MEGKEAIIARILSDAETKSAEIKYNAELKASETVGEAEEWAKRYTAVSKSAINSDIINIVSRRQTVGKLDADKIILREKQNLIEEVFNSAYDKLLSSDKKSYLSFVEKLLNENAEEGDEILLSSDGKISESDLKNMKVYSEKKLSVKKEKGDFLGGVKLIGKVCDKDLSFKGIVNSVKDDCLYGVSEILFGE